MNAKTKIGLEIIEAALFLGLLGDALLRATPWGFNVLLWIGALTGVMITLTWRRKREMLSRANVALYAALVCFAAGFVWRDSLTLQVLDVLIILAILAILSLPALNIQIHLTGFLQYALGALNSAFNAVCAPFALVFSDVKWKTIPQTGWTKHLAAVLRGLAIAAPLVLIFGALFMAADAAFEGIINNTFKIKPEIIFTHVLLFSFLTWICAGFLRGVLFGSVLSSEATTNFVGSQNIGLGLNKSDQSVIHNSAPDKFDEQPKNEISSPESSEKREWPEFLPDFLRLGAIEVGVILGLVNLLFLSFVIVQLRYFFGGMDFVQTTENFKLADYARRGFFELCWVAALMLPILLTTHFLLRKNNGLNEKLFRLLSAINIGLLFVIMFSAVNRMLLYTGSLGYGLTEMRFYPTAFMFWLALVFLWFGLTVLRGQHQRFAWGALWTAFFVVAGLHVLSPDDFIVRHNVKLMEQGRSFDSHYMRDLSNDAVPAIVKSLAEMSFEQQCAFRYEFLRRLQKDETRDFRTFNLSRWNAQQILLNHESDFGISGCSASSNVSRDDEF